jgi:hypothetical protein
LTSKYSIQLSALQSFTSWIDFNHFLNVIDNSNIAKIKETTTTHNRKLFKLGLTVQTENLNPDDLIVNHSNRILTDEEKDVIAHGLKFGLPPRKIDYHRYFLSFEKLFHQLKREQINEQLNDAKNRVRIFIKNTAFKLYYTFNPYIHNRGNDFYRTLKSLSDDKSIVVVKPDKGNGIVILNKADYIRKMENIIGDVTKFKLINDDWFTIILRHEDKVNRFISKLHKKSYIDKETYNELRLSSSQPGTLYGLPKVHKAGNPLRPILSAIGTSGYKLAKFLIPFLTPLTTNEYTIKDSFSFVEEICNFRNDNFVMASFDVKSLFTNIPVDETIEIASNTLYSDGSVNTSSLAKADFSQSLELAVKDILFIFNNKLYTQFEGIAMGNPLGPTMANVFLCYHEKRWLDECPIEFKPVYYRRYIDDTFLLFRDNSHISKFLDYLNSKHTNIEFTSEVEKDCKLNFLDVTVVQDNDKFITTVYRKDTFTGLGMNYSSFVPKSYKVNLIHCLIYRAFKICSDVKFFDAELKFLKNYFLSNLYPIRMVNSAFRKSLNKIYNPDVMVSNVKLKDIYVKFPYLGFQSNVMKRELGNFLSKFYPQIKINFIFNNSNTIGNLFKFKDILPSYLVSNVVYKFTCGTCSATYIGETSKQFKVRICQHRGVSFRTGNVLSDPENSKIFLHAVQQNHPISNDNFKILSKCSNEYDLKILESVYIHNHNPNLNEQDGSVPLHILK